MEKRKAARLELEMHIVLENINPVKGEGDIATFSVDVVDVSKTGIGFITDYKLEKHTFYKAHLVFETKDKMDIIVQVVREDPKENGQCLYGGVFVGISENDMFKIETFRLFSENDRV